MINEARINGKLLPHAHRDSHASSSATFSAIVQSQRERRLERQEMTSKSLHSLQIEEKAMAELLRAASGNPFERVKVVRKEKPMDPPIWDLAKR